ncbi:MAG: MBL fold metallo-hydrolase [Spirochaetes bacterium]|nr:MBL fold metallo-hydrolase [Spirochaetota bacterium]
MSLLIGCSLVACFLGSCRTGSEERASSASAPPAPPGSTVAAEGTESSAPEAFRGVKVTFLGNAGFLITINDKKILIDGLIKSYRGPYTTPGDIVRRGMGCQAPFDSVDLVLVTHAHEDHYNPASIRLHLANNPSTILATTRQVSSVFPELGERTVVFHAEPGKPDVRLFGDIRVEAYALPHGGPGSGQPENYGYVVSVDGYSFFHSGDMDSPSFGFDELRSYGFPEKKLDFAIVQHFYLTDDPAERRLLTEGIGASYIIPGHYALTEPPFSRDTILRNYPEAVLFDAALDSWSLPTPAISWLAAEPMPTGNFAGRAVALGREIHIVGGRELSGVNGDFHLAYDTATERWARRAPLNRGRANFAMASVSGKLYAIGGDNFLSLVEIYDPVKDAWTAGAPMPTKRQHIDCAVVGGRIYVMGGLESWTRLSDKNEAYDPASDSWRAMAPIPTPRHNPIVAELGGRIFVIGGAGDASSIWKGLLVVEAFDPALNTWERMPPLPGVRFQAAVAAINGAIVIAGGGDERDSISSSIDAFDPAAGAWRAIGELPGPMVAGYLVPMGDRLYALGGCDGGLANIMRVYYADSLPSLP